jgi:ABC-2 type transport system permease protein
LTAGAAHAWQTGSVGDVAGVLGGSLVQLPAVWVVMGIVVAAFGVRARYGVAGWVALTAFLLLGEVGAVLKLPRRVLDLSPFAHVPQLPGAPVPAAPVVALLGVAVLLGVFGLACFVRRDVE